jgi:hypothetical protein
MVEFKPLNKYSVSYPSNSVHHSLSHPSDANEAIQIALFNTIVSLFIIGTTTSRGFQKIDQI